MKLTLVVLLLAIVAAAYAKKGWSLNSDISLDPTTGVLRGKNLAAAKKVLDSCLGKNTVHYDPTTGKFNLGSVFGKPSDLQDLKTQLGKCNILLSFNSNDKNPTKFNNQDILTIAVEFPELS